MFASCGNANLCRMPCGASKRQLTIGLYKCNERENRKDIERYWSNDDLCFRRRFCTVRLYWVGYNLGKWDDFVMNHSPGAGSIARLQYWS